MLESIYLLYEAEQALFTPCACTRGKVISYVVVIVVVDTKIARSGDLDI